jgi:hypothetical protein
MAQTQTLQVRVDAAINAEGTLKSLRELKKLQRETVAGSAEFKRIQERINDIGDATKTAKGQSEDWIDSLAGAPGIVGKLGRGLDTITSSTNKFGLALKATGIGLVVSLVGMLVNAFTQNEKAMKKLEPIMIAFEQILGGLFKAFEPVLDAFVEMALEVLPYLIKGIGAYYSALYGLFTLIKEVGVGAGKLLIGIFTGNAEMLGEGIDQLKNSVSTAVDAGMEAYGRFDEGTKETTETQKKNLEAAAEAHNKWVEGQKANYEQLEKLRQADLDKAKAVAMANAKTDQERFDIEKKYAQDAYNSKKLLLQQTQALYPKNSKEYKDYIAQLTALDAEYLNKQTEFANKQKELDTKAFQDRVKSKQTENKQIIDDLTITYSLVKDLTNENSVESRRVQDEIFAAQKKTISDELALYEERKKQVGTLTEEEANRVKELELQQRQLTATIQIENNKRFRSDLDRALKTAEENKKVQDQQFQDMMKAAEGDLQLQQQLLDEKRRLDEAYYAEQLAREGLTAEQIKAIKDKQTADLRANAEAQISIEQKKFQAQQQLLGATAAALNALSDIVGKDTKKGKALAIAASLINTYAAIAGQLKAFSGVPVPAYAIVQAVATGLVGFKAVNDIIKTPVDGNAGGGGGSTGSGTSVPRPRGMATGGLVQGIGGPKSDLIPAMLSNGESVINAKSTSLFRPLLSSINSIGGGKRFADGGLAVGSFSQDQALLDLQNSLTVSQAPIKTYVVASDMTNQQMMDRNIKTRSTI